jgi:hypothetical protein
VLGEDLPLPLQPGFARDHWVHKETDLGKEDALWLHLDGHAVLLILQEVLKTEELDAAHLSLVFPVDGDFKLSTLQPKAA